MAEEKNNKRYIDRKEYKVVTCVSCGYLYKNGEKYCPDCGDDEININLEIYIKPILPARFIELKFILNKENGDCTFHSKE